MCMNQSLSIDILIPVYNREKYIEECILSCYESTHQNFNILIYDDGSIDSSVGTIERIRDTHKNIYLFGHNVNKGVSNARKFLLNVFFSPYACWLDSDDIMHPQRLEKQLDYMTNNLDVSVVYAGMENFRENKTNIVNTVTSDISRYNKTLESLHFNTTCPTAFFNQTMKVIPFDVEKRVGEDVMWLHEALKADLKVGYIPEFLYYYRQENEDRLTILKRKNKLKDIF